MIRREPAGQRGLRREYCERRQFGHRRVRLLASTCGLVFLALPGCVVTDQEEARRDTSVVVADSPSRGTAADRAAGATSRSDSAAQARVMAELVHAQATRAAVGTAGWEYVRDARVDLNGDGRAERVVVIAHVPLRGGEPLWDDGQEWNVYVESPDGARTYLLARMVQLGTVETLVAPAAEGGGRPVSIVVRSPTSLAIYDVRYSGPERFTVERVAQREIDPAVSPATPRGSR